MLINEICMCTVTRRRAGLSKLADDKTRQLTFTKRKNSLMKKAMELSVLCDCDIALVIFNNSGRLFQYSSTDMETLLEKYSRACQEPHERRSNDELFKQHYQSKPEDEIYEAQENMRAQKRQRDSEQGVLPQLPPQLKRAVMVHGPGMDTLGPGMPPVHVEGIKPAGFLDKRNYPVSPKSEKAYEDITSEFDRLFEQVVRKQGDPPGAPQRGHGLPLPQLGGSHPAVQAASAAAAAAGGKRSGERFKPLSIVVPENLSRAIPLPQNGLNAAASAAVAAARAQAVGSVQPGSMPPPSGQAAPGPAAGGGGAGSGPASEQTPSSMYHQQNQLHPRHDLGPPSSLNSEGHGGNGGGMGHLMALPSPGTAMFGPLSMGLLSVRGTGGLGGLTTPDSALCSVGQEFDWPSPSPRSNNAGGFASDDGGEVMSGDGLMVTGKSLNKVPGGGVAAGGDAHGAALETARLKTATGTGSGAAGPSAAEQVANDAGASTAGGEGTAGAGASAAGGSAPASDPAATLTLNMPVNNGVKLETACLPPEAHGKDFDVKTIAAARVGSKE